MSFISGYLLSVIGVVLISAVLTALTPNGKTAGLIKTLTRLACILIIISPIPNFLKGKTDGSSIFENFLGNSVIETDEAFIEYYRKLRVESAEEKLEQELLEKYDEACVVSLIWQADDETGDIQILAVRVTTETPLETEVKREMSQYISKNYCSEVLIE